MDHVFPVANAKLSCQMHVLYVWEKNSPQGAEKVICVYIILCKRIIVIFQREWASQTICFYL